jgi:hypothetical protein
MPVMDEVEVTYNGSCHCGAARFRFKSPPVTKGVRCNCSICVRRGSVMSVAYFPPDKFERLEWAGALEVYRWGDQMVSFYFCKTCGIHVFHDATTNPGHYRVNLGCVPEIDVFKLKIGLIDGKAF